MWVVHHPGRHKTCPYKYPNVGGPPTGQARGPAPTIAPLFDLLSGHQPPVPDPRPLTPISIVHQKHPRINAIMDQSVYSQEECDAGCDGKDTDRFRGRGGAAGGAL